MPLDLLITSVSRRGDGRSYIGFGETVSGGPGFVRLVAPTPSGILYPHDYQTQSDAEPRVGDLVRVEAPWADSRPYQPENRVVDHTAWQLLERPASLPRTIRLESLPPAKGLLFGTPGRAVHAAGPAGSASILYVEPEAVSAACEWDGRAEKYRTRVRFSVDGTAYDLPLTDLHYSRILRGMGEGAYALAQLGCRAPHGLRLLVTLGEPFHGFCYKMVASLLPRRTVTLRRDGSSSKFPLSIRHSAGCTLEQPRSFVVGA
jgi:hypothetical protein